VSLNAINKDILLEKDNKFCLFFLYNSREYKSRPPILRHDYTPTIYSINLTKATTTILPYYFILLFLGINKGAKAQKGKETTTLLVGGRKHP
jgi:hypothetical protein